jgi:peptidoglycan/xylan/chitin deacetylase (PgdA/CDA1 family)
MRWLIYVCILVIIGAAASYYIVRLQPPLVHAKESPYATGTTSQTALADAEASSTCASLPRSVPAAPTLRDGPIISFNFDDGFLSAYRLGIPILHAVGYHATEYIITGNFHKPGYISQRDVATLASEGDEIGAHTRTHPRLSKVPEAQAIAEICGSRADLIALGIMPVTFAYPEGDFSPSVEQIASAAGFIAARNTEAGLNNASTNRMLLRSYQVTASTTLSAVKYAIQQAVSNKEWLILVFHRIDDTGNAVSTPHQLLQQIVAYVQSQQIPVVTNAQGAAIMASINNTVSDLRSLPGR